LSFFLQSQLTTYNWTTHSHSVIELPHSQIEFSCTALLWGSLQLTLALSPQVAWDLRYIASRRIQQKTPFRCYG
jgi:hypothetical protein